MSASGQQIMLSSFKSLASLLMSASPDLRWTLGLSSNLLVGSLLSTVVVCAPDSVRPPTFFLPHYLSVVPSTLLSSDSWPMFRLRLFHSSQNADYSEQESLYLYSCSLNVRLCAIVRYLYSSPEVNQRGIVSPILQMGVRKSPASGGVW